MLNRNAEHTNCTANNAKADSPSNIPFEKLPAFYADKKCSKQHFMSSIAKHNPPIGNHITRCLFVRYSSILTGFSTRNRVFFRALKLELWAIHERNLKTLFAIPIALLTMAIILPPAVGIEKECPFCFPFLASTHRQSRSGAGFTAGATVKAAAFSLAVCSLA